MNNEKGPYKENLFCEKEIYALIALIEVATEVLP
jgi:hypothetical protein